MKNKIVIECFSVSDTVVNILTHISSLTPKYSLERQMALASIYRWCLMKSSNNSYHICLPQTAGHSPQSLQVTAAEPPTQSAPCTPTTHPDGAALLALCWPPLLFRGWILSSSLLGPRTHSFSWEHISTAESYSFPAPLDSNPLFIKFQPVFRFVFYFCWS